MKDVKPEERDDANLSAVIIVATALVMAGASSWALTWLSRLLGDAPANMDPLHRGLMLVLALTSCSTTMLSYIGRLRAYFEERHMPLHMRYFDKSMAVGIGLIAGLALSTVFLFLSGENPDDMTSYVIVSLIATIADCVMDVRSMGGDGFEDDDECGDGRSD